MDQLSIQLKYNVEELWDRDLYNYEEKKHIMAKYP